MSPQHRVPTLSQVRPVRTPFVSQLPSSFGLGAFTEDAKLQTDVNTFLSQVSQFRSTEASKVTAYRNKLQGLVSQINSVLASHADIKAAFQTSANSLISRVNTEISRANSYINAISSTY